MTRPQFLLSVWRKSLHPAKKFLKYMTGVKTFCYFSVPKHQCLMRWNWNWTSDRRLVWNGKQFGNKMLSIKIVGPTAFFISSVIMKRNLKNVTHESFKRNFILGFYCAIFACEFRICPQSSDQKWTTVTTNEKSPGAQQKQEQDEWRSAFTSRLDSSRSFLKTCMLAEAPV